ncbi:hypothetical protein F4813DRAFT_382840 [Daldinia decipiens]|uniref:uncharacterized protein n=1 Tax=Daldinia decipiens TaxID=326647 RepID=UPI0020C3D05E|nr:uncharacterized protein F4813DRAFT_382840 [Daldinia decipiens]KAI1654250.1 hypothetical protein F4813DRAFT_382840 [Daldinia decipiens]
MNISQWLDTIEPKALDQTDPRQLPETFKRKRRQMHTPTTSETQMDVALDVAPDATPPIKRQRPNNPIDNDLYMNRTPRARSGKAWSISDKTTSSRSSVTSTSRTSPTKRLARLEVAPENPVLVAQISRNDTRIPAELKAILGELDSFQSRVGIVPSYLGTEIDARAEYDDNFYNFTPSTFEADSAATISDPKLSLYEILKVFESARECLNEDHAEATWNTLVHWPVFELALGSIADVAEAANPVSAPRDQAECESRQQPIRVRGMPCTTARLIDRTHGSKMVDYCIFVEPQAREATKIAQLRERFLYINHTDYYPLRRRPIVLSAESKKPGENARNAQLQLSVWQAAQWAILEKMLSAGEETERPAAVPFLPALIIQGHEWHFAASTRFNNETILWIQQPIGATESILGIFQIVRALRHIAAWIRGTYWPWYRRAVLHLQETDRSI